MELALILKASDPEPDKAALAKANLLYVGNEFCEAQLPTVARLKLAARQHPGKRLALLTPLLTQAGLRTAEAALSGGLCDEVIVNDIGLLNRLAATRGRRLRLTLGRLLVQSLQHSLRSSFFLAFLQRYGVNAFEADSVESCGYLPPGPNYNCHLHAPYIYLAHSRYCSLAGHFCSECRTPCAGLAQPLESSVVKKMFVRGNSYLRVCPEETARARLAAGPGRVTRLVVNT